MLPMTRKRGSLLLWLLLFFLMFCIPFLSMGRSAVGGKGSSSAPAPTKSGSSSPAAQPVPASAGSFRILDSVSGKTLTVDDRSFLYGGVAAEMSPDAPPEALRAQAVACYTYYGRLREAERKSPSSELKGADFSADLQKGEKYVSPDLMKTRWGSSYEEEYRKLTDAVSPVFGQVLKYGGELIDSTYFAISSGNTDNASDVWGGSCPYLVSVASPGDCFAGGYQTSAVFSADQFKTCVLTAAPKANLSGNPSSWLGPAQRTSAGMVKTISIGGQKADGPQVRAAFNLRSSDFSVSYADGKFTFLVKGYGLNVGMSQIGAEYMATQGSTYRQILSWYYPGTELTSV